MKRVLVICDGMADEEVESLGGRTPLEYAATPAMDALAKAGRCGSLQTVPAGLYPGSEVAILTILGYSPELLPAGRGPLEARGLGMAVPPGYTAMRYIIKKSGTDIEQATENMKDFSFIPFCDIKGICSIPSGDVAYLEKIRDIEFWSGDIRRSYPSLSELHPKDDGSPSRFAIIGAVPLLAGIAAETGADWIKPDRATGTPHTSYSGKATAAINALKNHDFVVIHIEACDYASHEMDVATKVRSIENIDLNIISPLREYIDSGEEPVAIAVMSDHPSLCAKGVHSRGNSPFLYYYQGIAADDVAGFDEKKVKNGSLKNISEIYGR